MSIIACLALASVLSCATTSSTEPAAYITHLGSNLPNNSYIPFQNVRRHDTNSGSKGVECHTDLTTCCNGSDGTAGGNWFFDNGITVGYDAVKNVYSRRYAQKGVLYQLLHAQPSHSGIYTCVIPVQSSTSTNNEATLYVGIYLNQGGNVTILDGIRFTLHSELRLLASLSPVTPLVDLLPLSLGPETLWKSQERR